MLMRSLFLPSVFIVSSFLAVPAVAANGLIHVPATHSTIQAAIDAATANDTIVVAAGSYAGFTVGNTTATPLSIVGDPSAGAVTVTGAMILTNTTRVNLRRINAVRGGAAPCLTLDGATAIWVEECDFETTPAPGDCSPAPSATVTLLNGSDLNMVRCTVDPYDGYLLGPQDSCGGSEAVESFNSTFGAWECDLRGGRARPNLVDQESVLVYGTTGYSAIYAFEASGPDAFEDVFLSGTALRAGDGADAAVEPCAPGTAGGYVVTLDGAQMTEIGFTADSTLFHAGIPGMMVWPTCPGGTNPSTWVALLNGATESYLTGVPRNLTTPPITTSGSTMSFTFEGQVGEAYALQIGTPWPSFYFPPTLGIIALNWQTSTTILSGTIPAGGLAGNSLTAPSIGSLQAQSVFLQAAFATSGGVYHLSPPSSPVILAP